MCNKIIPFSTNIYFFSQTISMLLYYLFRKEKKRKEKTHITHPTKRTAVYEGIRTYSDFSKEQDVS